VVEGVAWGSLGSLDIGGFVGGAAARLAPGSRAPASLRARSSGAPLLRTVPRRSKWPGEHGIDRGASGAQGVPTGDSLAMLSHCAKGGGPAARECCVRDGPRFA